MIAGGSLGRSAEPSSCQQKSWETAGYVCSVLFIHIDGQINGHYIDLCTLNIVDSCTHYCLLYIQYLDCTLLTITDAVFLVC